MQILLKRCRFPPNHTDLFPQMTVRPQWHQRTSVKGRNHYDETAAVEALLAREGLIKGYQTTHFMFFSKHPVSEATRSKYDSRVTFLSVENLYA